jgi:hypothetical protein
MKSNKSEQRRQQAHLKPLSNVQRLLKNAEEANNEDVNMSENRPQIIP